MNLSELRTWVRKNLESTPMVSRKRDTISNEMVNVLIFNGMEVSKVSRLDWMAITELKYFVRLHINLSNGNLEAYIKGEE